MTELAMTARCQICNRSFAGPQLAIVGKGADLENNRIIQFAEKMAMHLSEKHKDVFQQILFSGQEFQGMLILQQYATESPALKEQFDVCRWKIHQSTLNTRLSDEQISKWVEAVIPDLVTLVSTSNFEELKRNLGGMITAVRDQLEEPGKYTFQAMDGQIKPVKAS